VGSPHHASEHGVREFRFSDLAKLDLPPYVGRAGMSFAWRIATVRGIAIRIHATFLLVVGLGALQWGVPHGPRGAVFGALLMCCLFACVALHELGHSLVAQRFGVSVRDILLLPIGGVARLGREPKTATHELLIALAGPAVNVVIAALLIGVSLSFMGASWFFDGRFLESLIAPPSVVTLLSSIIAANIALAVFNMIPALPMDGGRVFRALLSMALGKLRATTVAAAVGQVLAAGFAIFGVLSGNLILALIGAFVFVGAGQERAMAKIMASLGSLRAGDAVDRHAIVLEPGDMLGVALEFVLRSGQSNFAVVLGDRVLGTIGREDVVRAVRMQGPAIYVSGVMQRDLAEVDASTPLVEVRYKLIERGGQPLLVRGPDGYLGLIGLDDVARAATMADVLHHVGRERAGQGSGDRVSMF
jgi:Zn-dependent protease/predicted transcriptional regulator